MEDVCDKVDTDLLGLGVRLGVYLQVASVIILNSTGVRGVAQDHCKAAALTLAAILLVLMLKLAKGEVHAAEFLCVLLLAGMHSILAILGTRVSSKGQKAEAAKGSLRSWRVPFSCLRPGIIRHGKRIPGFSEKNDWHMREGTRLDDAARADRRRERSIMLRHAVFTAYYAISIWFWQSGYVDLQRDGCGTVWVSWIYVRIPAFGWFRYLMLVVCYAFTVPFGWDLLHRLYLGVMHEQVLLQQPSALAGTSDMQAVSISVTRVCAREQRARLHALCTLKVFGKDRCARIARVFILLCCWVLFISLVEMSMRYNNFTSDEVSFAGIASTGQVLSIFLGGAMLISSLYASSALPEDSRPGRSQGAPDAKPRTGVSDEQFEELAKSLKADADERLMAMQREAAATARRRCVNAEQANAPQTPPDSSA